jgi:uncharacterized protein (TIGR03545 family)
MSEKKKGIIRKGAVIPFVVVTTLTVLFNIFLLDSTIKGLGEHFGSQLNGAEVNIASVESRFSDLNFQMKGIQFTDPQNPSMNRFEIGLIEFSFLWDGILRGKAVVELAKVGDVVIQTKRKSPGRIIPLSEREMSEDTKKSLAAAKEEFKGNVFGDLASVLGGTDSKDQMKEIKGELKSQKRYKELQKEIKDKEKEWDERIANLPKDEDFDALKKRAKAINFKDLGDLKKAGKVLKESKAVKNEAKRMKTAYSDANKQFKADTKYFKNSIKQADDLIKEDMKDLGNRMNIPSIDPQSIAKVLFGQEFADKVGQAQQYVDKAKEYMPEKNSKDEVAKKKPKAPARGQGKNYQFGTPTTYPLLWVKKVEINSRNKQGTLEGKIVDITSDQATLNKPTKLNLRGDFPGKDVRDFKATATFDHRSIANDSANVFVGSYPVGAKKLSNSESVTFNIAKANAQMDFSANMKGDNVSFVMNNTMNNVDYEIDAKSSTMKSILENVGRETQKLNINAIARGTLSNLSWKMSTNLADAMNRGLKSHVNQKIKKMQNNLEDSIKKKIAGDKDALLAKLSGSNKYLSKLSGGEGKANDIIGGMDKDVKAGKKAKTKQKLDKLKKKLKIKF